MKSLKESLNESKKGKIYVVVIGESNEGIYDLMAAFSNEREANKFMKEHEKTVSGVLIGTNRRSRHWFQEQPE